MKKIAISVFLLFSSISEAVLPPLYSTVEEYQRLLKDRELVEKLDAGQAILSIERVEGGFIILTPKYSLTVDIVAEPQNQPGPAHFHLHFHDPLPR
jgi:hypothetical protein